MIRKKNIALIGGGYSEESKVSLQSCANLQQYLPTDDYHIYLVVFESPSYWWVKYEEERITIDRGDFSFNIGNQKITFDGAFIYIHGTPGEDGKLQQYFDFLGIPHLGSSAYSSFVCFNKQLAKYLVAEAGIAAAKGVLIPKGQHTRMMSRLVKLNFPLIVKPNEGGSSVGLHLVESQAELLTALQQGENENMLVEEYIQGREFSVGVLRKKEDIVVLPITEIISHNKLFDYEAKYHGKSDEITPARITEDLKKDIEETAKKIYIQCACDAIVRMEMMYSISQEKLFFLEVNTIPGFTAQSLLPQQLHAAGINFRKLYVDLFHIFFHD